MIANMGLLVLSMHAAIDDLFCNCFVMFFCVLLFVLKKKH